MYICLAHNLLLKGNYKFTAKVIRQAGHKFQYGYRKLLYKEKNTYFIKLIAHASKEEIVTLRIVGATNPCTPPQLVTCIQQSVWSHTSYILATIR